MRLIDTNVILRFLLANKEERYVGVYTFFSKLEDGLEKVECKPLIFFQTIFVLKSFYGIDKSEIMPMMSSLLDYKGFYIKEKMLIKRTLELWREYNTEIIDCYLMACLEEKGDKDLITYDNGFEMFKVNRIEP
ncbi:PIN domain-containing protein [bacterium]|nr:PIN domain-containing protein [bacterium]MBU1599431.1 PIN domain-containing protein [bacterium]